MAPSPLKPLDPEDDDIDPETIQSAADVSFSLALDMVQSWMPGGSASSSVDPGIIESRKKLEEYMRRPPRLGVGAPLPSSSTVQNHQHQATHHEAQHLKNRLVGSGAARRRAEDAKSNGPHSNGKSHEEEGDEEESRASVVKRKKQKQMANGKPNGLSVFGTATTVTAAPSATPKAAPLSPPTAAIHSPLPPSQSQSPSPSTPAKSSILPEREISPTKPTPPSPPNEPMGIHTLPPKFSLAAKVWARSNGTPSSSPVGSDRTHTKRRKVASMLPPQAPETGWNMQVPASRSPSVSASASSQVPSTVGAGAEQSDKSAEEQGPEQSQAGPSSSATAHLSRKERKRLRREAAQQVASQEKLVQASAAPRPDRELLSGAEIRPRALDGGRDAQPLSARGAHHSDDSDASDDEGKEVSEIGENVSGKLSDRGDTVQQEGKKKRKRRAKKKPGPG